MSVVDILTKADFDKFATAQLKTSLFFWADWHEPSKPGGPMTEIYTALSSKYTSVQFARVEAEAVPEMSLSFNITVVPTFVTLLGTTVLNKVEGANPAELSKLIKQLSESEAANGAAVSAVPTGHVDIDTRLKQLVTSAPVILFMKGEPIAPRCGFSRQIVEILQGNDIPFASFDILKDEEVRAGLKVLSDWPTYPQLYVGGEFVGGLDIVKEMVATGENLRQQLGVDKLQLPPPPPTLEERLKVLINSAPVMVFMKGNPAEPRCGFSKTLVGILKEQTIDFQHFDILTDEEVRAGLKTYSDWPTYPQLYVKGDLVGGLDIVKEMVEAGPLKSQLGIE